VNENERIRILEIQVEELSRALMIERTMRREFILATAKDFVEWLEGRMNPPEKQP
jgi:hypothetical protein